MSALVIIAILAGGLAATVIAVQRACIAREESERSLFYDPETRAAAATRRMLGLYVRTAHGLDSADAVTTPTSCRAERRSQ